MGAMRALILFGTNSGGTQEVAELVAEVLRSRRHRVMVARASEVEPARLANHDLVVFGSCTWELVTSKGSSEGQLSEDFIAFVKKVSGRTFPSQRFAVFALGDRRYLRFCAAADHLEALVAKLQGTKIGPTLRIDGYFFRLTERRAQVRTWAETIAASLVA